MAQDPYRYFRLEARELHDQLSKDALELEKKPADAALIQRLLRLAHTLKGAARVVKQPEIADRAHAIEDALSPFRQSGGPVLRDVVSKILGHLDAIEGHILALAPPESTDATTKGGLNPDEGIRTVRADIGEMDALLHGVSETHTFLNGLRTAVQALEQERHLANLLVAQLAPRGAGDGVRHDRFGANPAALSIAEELRGSLAKLNRNIDFAADQMDRELRELRDAAEQLRLVSTADLLTFLERTARDAAQALSKQVVFEGKGGDLRLDAHVLGAIRGALVQIVRNAVAHGIESDAERRAAGKAVAGRVTVDVSRRGRRIVFECRDDGRGVDLEAVRRIAVERGILGKESKAYGAEELIRLLLRGGISTSVSVSETSGRGVGLDVVREAIEQLNGEVSVRTERDKGTTFKLVVPPSLASMEALKVESSGTVAAIPLDAVRRSMHIGAADISLTSTGASVVYEDKAIPFVPLSRALNGTHRPAGRGWTIVVLNDVDGFAAIGVDRLLGVSRIVVHPLPELAPASRIVAGATLDAEGNPELVLDPDGLATEARAGKFLEPASSLARRPVLVIDDSLTTRMLEQSILESAGYEVDLALSGEEGLERARRKRYALFLVDVEMPGMDGFTFVERTRSDPSLRDVPAILVTSRAAPEDLQRGQDVGARGYIVKSDFDQAKLLSMIGPLVS